MSSFTFLAQPEDKVTSVWTTVPPANINETINHLYLWFLQTHYMLLASKPVPIFFAIFSLSKLNGDNGD
jgi:hypothetical protein